MIGFIIGLALGGVIGAYFWPQLDPQATKIEKELTAKIEALEASIAAAATKKKAPKAKLAE
jgi:uncharacterized membrane protein YciS (DUF1049 family)